MNISQLKAARSNVCKSQEAINDDISDDIKNISPEIKKAFDDVESALKALYFKVSHEIVWSDKNEQ